MASTKEPAIACAVFASRTLMQELDGAVTAVTSIIFTIDVASAVVAVNVLAWGNCIIVRRRGGVSRRSRGAHGQKHHSMSASKNLLLPFA